MTNNIPKTTAPILTKPPITTPLFPTPILTSRILVIGAFSPDPTIYTYATSFYQALQKLSSQPVTLFNYRQSYLPKILPYRLRKPLNQYIMNCKLLAQAQELQPELIFIIKGELLFPWTLQKLKNLGAKVVNFYPDNPFAVWNGNSNANVLQALPIYDCFLFWAPDFFPALHAAGCQHTCFFPFAFDPDIITPTTRQSTPDLASDVCFIGTWEPERERQLTELIQQLPKLDLAIWGNLWQEKTTYAPLKKHIRGKAIYGANMQQAMRSAKITLNFIRQQNMGAHNMRSIEAPAAGAFLLTERTHQQAQELFTEDVSIACFSGTDELVAKIKFYLQDEKTRYRIAQQGQHHVQQYGLPEQLRTYFITCHLFAHR